MAFSWGQGVAGWGFALFCYDVESHLLNADSSKQVPSALNKLSSLKFLSTSAVALATWLCRES